VIGPRQRWEAMTVTEAGGMPGLPGISGLPGLRLARLRTRALDGGMARGIADPGVLARTLTAYGAPSRHRRACGLAGPGAADGREVEALVVTRDGRVLWHATGAPGAASPGEVDAMLRALDPRSGPSAHSDPAPSR